jgi:hypothetical protein
MSYSPITSKLSAVIFWIVKGTLRADSTLKKICSTEGNKRVLKSSRFNRSEPTFTTITSLFSVEGELHV